jgi:hypothetical protein
VAVGGVRAGEVTGGDERANGRGPSARGRAARESGAVAADGWGRSVSERGGERGASTGGRADGPRGPRGEGGERGHAGGGGGERGESLSRIRPSREGERDFSFFLSFSLFFSLIPFLL